MLIRPAEQNRRSVVKAVSWRVLGSIDTFALSAIITGNFKLAGSIAFVEVATKMLLYYLHERAWARVGWGQSKAAPPGLSQSARVPAAGIRQLIASRIARVVQS